LNFLFFVAATDATYFAQLIDFSLLSDVNQLGIRSESQARRAHFHDLGMPVFADDAITKRDSSAGWTSGHNVTSRGFRGPLRNQQFDRRHRGQSRSQERSADCRSNPIARRSLLFIER
jgi:hypothetical protein